MTSHNDLNEDHVSCSASSLKMFGNSFYPTDNILKSVQQTEDCACKLHIVIIIKSNDEEISENQYPRDNSGKKN